MYSLKSGVDISNLCQALQIELPQITKMWDAFFPVDPDGLTITSGHEETSKHSVDSLHYTYNDPKEKGEGNAIDIRVFDVDFERAKTRFVPSAKLMLGEDFDIVFEEHKRSSGLIERHIHIEYDEK